MSHNSYWLVLDQVQPMPMSGATTFGWGLDYYIEVLRCIEQRGQLTGLSFFLAITIPEALPVMDRSTVLLIIGDESFRRRSYLRDLCAIVRCYGDSPLYLDGFPDSLLKVSALLQYSRKCLAYTLESVRLGNATVSEIRRRTIQTTLGYYARTPSPPADCERPVDFAFLGSIEARNQGFRSLFGTLKTIFGSPKTLARQKLLRSIGKLDRSWRSSLFITKSFADSQQRHSNYISTMQKVKVSLCPRGSNYETYRFNESLKLGCVVISEVIPQTEFYLENPAVVVNGWRKLPQALARVLDDDDLRRRLSRRSIEFWQQNLSEKITAERITSHILKTLVKRSRFAFKPLAT